MSQLEQQIKLFLQGTGIKQSAELNSSLKQELQQSIHDFFQQAPDDKHLIFKRSILYFYNKNEIINSIPCSSTDENVYSFDGVKVTRIKPEYYFGSAALLDAGEAVLSGLEIGYSNNNNNNNNNNNGNNNG